MDSSDYSVSFEWQRSCKRIKSIHGCHSMTSEGFEDCFFMGPELGRGQSGIVRLCLQKSDGRKFACKTIPKTPESPRSVLGIQREISLMAKLSGHRNIVGMHQCFEEGDKIHLVMDYCASGDLYECLRSKGRFQEAEAADIFRQLVDAISFCHSHNVIHRDVKPENVLLVKNAVIGGDLNERLLCLLTGRKVQKYRVQLADFGQAVEVQKGNKVNGLAGSAMYMAPEVLTRQSYDSSVDIWSLGVLLHILLCGYPPFIGCSETETIEQILERPVDFSGVEWCSVSTMAIDLVSGMLKKNPEERLTIEEILLHPWMVNHTINSLTDLDLGLYLASIVGPPAVQELMSVLQIRTQFQEGQEERSVRNASWISAIGNRAQGYKKPMIA